MRNATIWNKVADLTVVSCVAAFVSSKPGFLKNSDCVWHVNIENIPDNVTDNQLLDLYKQTIISNSFIINFEQLGPGKVIFFRPFIASL